MGSSSRIRAGRAALRKREMALLVELVSKLSLRNSARFRDMVATMAPKPCCRRAMMSLVSSIIVLHIAIGIL